MLKTLRRMWRYVGTKLGMSFDAMADPKVQLQQAIEEMQKRHQQLIDQAAAVIGNLRELDIKIGNAEQQDAKLTQATKESLRLSGEARAKSDNTGADRYEATARAFAAQLASIESQLTDLRDLREKAQAASDNAKKMVDQNAFALREAMAKRDQLTTQLESAKMQEQMNKSMQAASGLAAPGAVPTFEEVQTKVASRYAKAMGKAELLSGSVDAQMVEVQQKVLAGAGDAKLDEIRRSMGLAEGSNAKGLEAPGEPTIVDAASDTADVSKEKK
jgi:phage shock protein A